VILLGALASACSSGPVPQTTASAYLAAWSKQDWAGMRQLADSPPAYFVAVNSAAFTDLQVAQASFTAGTMKTTGSTAQEPVTERLTLKGLGTVTLRPTLHLVQRSGH
jgi:L-rhamnose isomerase